MAQDNGWLGSVYSGSTKIAEMTEWDITFDGGVVETTAFGDDAVKRGYTIPDCSGSFSGFADMSDTSGQNTLVNMFVDGGTLAAVWLYLYVSGSVGYYGEAVVSVGKSAQAGQTKQRFRASFQEADKWYVNI